MANKRPLIPWDAPVIENPKTNEEIEVFDAMLSLQYGGNHVRTMLQNLARKRRGTGPRRFTVTTYTPVYSVYNDNIYADLDLDEYSNPTLRFGYQYTPRRANSLALGGRRNKKKIVTPPTPQVISLGFIRFEQDGIYIKTDNSNSSSYESREFVRNIVNAYTNYKQQGYSNVFTYTKNNQPSNLNVHKPIGGAITTIQRTLCKDKACQACPPIKIIITQLNQFNTDLKNEAKGTGSKTLGLPGKIQSFRKGYKLPYSRPDEHPPIMESNFKRIKTGNAK